MSSPVGNADAPNRVSPTRQGCTVMGEMNGDLGDWLRHRRFRRFAIEPVPVSTKGFNRLSRAPFSE